MSESILSNYFIKKLPPHNDSHYQAECMNCHTVLSWQTKRLVQHQISCYSSPNAFEAQEDSDDYPISQSSNPFEVKNKQLKLSKFIDSIDEDGQNKADELLAKFFYSSSISFSQINNKYLKDFLKLIRPSYFLPSYSRLRTTMLQEEYEKMSKLISRVI